MFNLRLKLKVLLIMLLGLPAVMGAGVAKNASASCGVCVQLYHEGGYYGWGCVTDYGHNCVATSTGCTQCSTCSCS
jgi:hypothetical protein